jgi:predicted amidohydrolase
MRIAAVQCHPIADDPDRAFATIADRMRWADAEAVDLVLFPEAFLLGHSYDRETIRARALNVSDAALGKLCDSIANVQASLVVGAFNCAGNQIFNSAFVVESGRIVGHYAKAYPNEPGVTAGNDFPTFLCSGVRFGINICNDANHADAAARIAAQNAVLIVYPLNNMLPLENAELWREKSVANLIERALQTGCWIASADVAGRSGNSMSFGCTAIVSPDGHVVARVPEMIEGVALYDLA